MGKQEDIEIGKRLRELRGIAAASKLARLLGIPESTYRAYEYGQRHVSDKNKIVIARFYKRPVGEIFFDP